MIEDKNPTQRRCACFLKIALLLYIQIILGYYSLIFLHFTAQNHTNILYLVRYIVALTDISYTIYCFTYIYRSMIEEFPHHIKTIKIIMILFYISSVVSNVLASGSYSPFFLIGIKIAQNQLF